MYDTLAFTRALNAFNNSFRGASALAIAKGFAGIGATDNTVLIFSDLMDSQSLFPVSYTHLDVYKRQVALRNRAETCLLDVRCHDGSNPEDRFAKAASTLSNCPSGAEGGHLGWLSAADCAPEFSKELFGHAEVGVLPRLVHSRFGFHVVEVLGREPGVEQAFEAVRGAVAMSMRQTTYVTMLRQYLRQLAGQAEIIGVAIEAAETPLDQ